MNARAPEQALLGLDGFRDVVDDTNQPGRMNRDTLAGLTQSLVTEAGGNPVCVLGRDPRPSGVVLEEGVIAGAQAAGAEVVYLGVAPTPAIFKIAQYLEAGSAVSLTPSHIAEPYHGWKGTFGGNKLNDGEAARLERRYHEGTRSGTHIPPLADRPEVRGDLVELYKQQVVEWVERTFERQQPLLGKKLVYDGANGAAAAFTPDILRRLGADVTEFACDGQGKINVKCGAGDLSGVQDFLRSRPDLVADPDFIGAVANDGDGDRIMALGAKLLPDGQMTFEQIDGNHILELLAGGQPGVVATEYANNGMIERLQQQGTEVVLCPNGDINVTQALEQQGWPIGAEFTGHVVIRDWLSSGDGVLVAGLLSATAANQGKSFYELAQERPMWPEKMFKAMLGRNHKGELDRPDVRAAIADATAELGDDGRFVVRPSGTEKGVYRVWGNGRHKEQIARLVKRIGRTLIFPKTFADELVPIAIEDLDEDGQDALRQLKGLGHTALVGLRKEDLRDVGVIADQDAVYKYCRRDSTERFGGRETPQAERIAMATKWHGKGRLFFQLQRQPKWFEKVRPLAAIARRFGRVSLSGYGWTGPEKPEGPPTFAVRVNEQDAGKGIGTLFTRLIVSATRMRTNEDIHLETWQSNHAERAYLKAGAVRVGEPELGRRPAGRDETPDEDGMVEDYRVTMVFPSRAK